MIFKYDVQRNDLQVSLVVQSYFPVDLTVSFSFQRCTAMSQPPSKSLPESRKALPDVEAMGQWADAEWSPFLAGIDHAAEEEKRRATDEQLLKQFQEAVAKRLLDLEQSTSTSSISKPKEG